MLSGPSLPLMWQDAGSWMELDKKYDSRKYKTISWVHRVGPTLAIVDRYCHWLMYSKLGGVTLFAKHIGECRQSVIFITLFLCRETQRISKSRDQGAGKEQTAYDLLYEVALTRVMFRHCARSIISRVLSWKEYPSWTICCCAGCILDLPTYFHS